MFVPTWRLRCLVYIITLFVYIGTITPLIQMVYGNGDVRYLYADQFEDELKRQIFLSFILPIGVFIAIPWYRALLNRYIER